MTKWLHLYDHAVHSGSYQALGRAHARPDPACAFRLHQLHRPRQSFHRGAAAQRRAEDFRFAARPAAFLLLLDLRAVPDRLRLAGGPLQRELGNRRRILSVERGYGGHGPDSRLRGADGFTPDPGHGRIGGLPVVFQNPGAPFSRVSSRPGQRADRRRFQVRTGDRHPARRSADGNLRLAAVLHRAGPGQPVVAGTLDPLHAARRQSTSRRPE